MSRTSAVYNLHLKESVSVESCRFEHEVASLNAFDSALSHAFACAF